MNTVPELDNYFITQPDTLPTQCQIYEVTNLTCFYFTTSQPNLSLIFLFCTLYTSEKTAWEFMDLFIYMPRTMNYGQDASLAAPQTLMLAEILDVLVLESNDKFHWWLLTQLFTPLACYKDLSLLTHSTRIEGSGHVAILWTHLSVLLPLLG